MSEELRKALESVPAEGFAKIIPQRRAAIEAAPDLEPVWEYQTNRVAKALHPEKQYVTIAEITDRPGAKSYTLVPDPSRGTESLAYFRAGQYVSVDLEIGGSVLTRAYTLACSPGDALRGSYTLTIKRNQDGFASNFIHDNWKEGMKLSVSGPDGDLNYEPLRDAKQIVGLAGGSGITPFFSLANAIQEGIEDCSLTLLYGCRSEAEIVYRQELDALAESCGKFRVVYVLSDEDKPGFEHGFLTAELIKKYAPAEDYSIFMCGPQAMYRFCDGEVEKLGLPRRRVRHEAYGEYHNADRDDGFPQDAVGKTFRLTVELPDGQRVIPAKSGESL
ncbi:MAG: FAD-binding oxidoreductase, partial [Eubacteriales bacterium]|nr:FAD-binding oxidoreductase [Eubacteriales bacterium]